MGWLVFDKYQTVSFSPIRATPPTGLLPPANSYGTGEEESTATALYSIKGMCVLHAVIATLIRDSARPLQLARGDRYILWRSHQTCVHHMNLRLAYSCRGTPIINPSGSKATGLIKQ